MSKYAINDPFMNPNRFGYPVIPFQINGGHEARADIPKWRINRSNARSMGKSTFTHTKQCKCGSFERRVYNNECAPCFKLSKVNPSV